MTTYGYCRISTPKQSIERQVRNIQAAHPDAHILQEAYTGTSLDRPEWSKLQKVLKPGDTIVFDSVSRMSRNADEGYAAYEDLYQRGIELIFLREPHISTSTYKGILEKSVPMTGTNVDFILEGINKYLLETFPHLCSFYLRGGSYAMVGQNEPDLAELRKTLSERFTGSWKTGAGELRLGISFVEADMDLMNCPSDRLVNTLMISLDELSRVAEPDTSRSLMDSIDEINQKLEIRRCLEKSLDRDELEVFLQPLMDSKTGKRIAAEALVRLRDDNGNLIRPDLFISMAEQEGYIVRLGEQVLAKVCRFIRDHDMEAMGIQWINVNLSPVQFMSQDIPGRFSAILRVFLDKPETL